MLEVVMDKFVEGDSYVTPEDRHRKILDKALMGGRHYFYSRYLKNLLRYRREVLSGKYDNEAWVKSAYETLELVEDCGGKFEISGLDNLKTIKKPVVFVSNHMSTLETHILPLLIEPYLDVTFIVKESLIKTPIFGHILQSREPVAVSRENPREDLIKVFTEGKKILNGGRSIIIFPQSFRTTVFKEEDFNTLGVKLALKADVSIVPVALKTDLWSSGKILKDFGPLKRENVAHFAIGKEIPITANRKEIHAKIINFIKGKLDTWE